MPPLIVSNHSLGQIAQCSTLAHLSFVLRLQSIDRSIPAQVGTAFHAGAEATFNDLPSDVALKALVDAHPESDPNRPPLVEIPSRLSIANVGTIFKEWYAHFSGDRRPFEIVPSHTEGWFSLPLDPNGDIILRGRFDFAIREPNVKTVVPGDIKTTGKITSWAWDDYILNSQVSAYLWACRTLYNDDRITQMIVNMIELSDLPKPGRKCRTHGTDYSECRQTHAKWEMAYAHRTELQLIEWQKTAIFLAKRLKQLVDDYPVAEALPYLRMQGTFTGACKLCQFQDFCRSDRPIDWIGTRLIKRADPQTGVTP